MRFHIIRNARIENVGNSQSCMVSKLRIIWKQTVAETIHGDRQLTVWFGTQQHADHILIACSCRLHAGIPSESCTMHIYIWSLRSTMVFVGCLEYAPGDKVSSPSTRTTTSLHDNMTHDYTRAVERYGCVRIESAMRASICR